MPLFRIKIDCNIAGCEEEHEIEAANIEDAQSYAEQLAQETFMPNGWVEEEIEEN